MQVDWSQQWICIPYQDKSVYLWGNMAALPAGSVLQLSIVLETLQPQHSSVSPVVQPLLDEFAHLFTPPLGLPPSRNCDHTIPLIAGAQPVFVRPYRYAPILKFEIEKQVNDMLQQGIIQPSSSAFASPVLLVKKKDSTWRFCINYRQLNAITAKTKYPVPIIEELLDELAGASYFTTLDLQAGFHQIRMKEGEEFKTAF